LDTHISRLGHILFHFVEKPKGHWTTRGLAGSVFAVGYRVIEYRTGLVCSSWLVTMSLNWVSLSRHFAIACLGPFKGALGGSLRSPEIRYM
jgi:hypothetical protein